MSTEISIVVVSWNASKYLEECLTSIEHLNLGVSVEIIVVDNDSHDGTPEMVSQNFPQVKLIRNSANRGFAAANNIGIRAAQGRYLALVNSDVNVPSDCLEHLYDFLEQNPAVGVVGPRMLGPDGHIGRSYMRFPTVWNCLCTALCLDVLFRGHPLFSGVLMTRFKADTTSDVDVLNGWFLMIRRQALEDTGVLDENFFMYGEDIDWSYRFRKAGWRRVYCSEARALHYGGASSAGAPTRFYIEMHRANMQYWRKHHTAVGVFAYWLTTVLHQGLRVAGYSLLYLIRPTARREAAFKVERSASCVAWLMGAHPAGR
jgi:GT2 family glycosyltransferase